jgi:uncharacterized protein DUF6448
MSVAALERVFLSAVLVVVVSVLWPARVLAHCDGLDGPVVKAARAALETRNVDAVLIWVRAEDEPEIKRAFEQTLAVRRLNSQAKELADRFFFETVVRVHRTAEGAPYTGLQPAGRDLGPAIPAADSAIEQGSLEQLASLLSGSMSKNLRLRFDEVRKAKTSAGSSVAAGREYVRAYVEFIHYVERLHEAATTKSEGHFAEPR